MPGNGHAPFGGGPSKKDPAMGTSSAAYPTQGRQPKGSRKPGLVASASAGRPAQLAGYGHCPDPKGC